MCGDSSSPLTCRGSSPTVWYTPPTAFLTPATPAWTTRLEAAFKCTYSASSSPKKMSLVLRFPFQILLIQGVNNYSNRRVAAQLVEVVWSQDRDTTHLPFNDIQETGDTPASEGICTLYIQAFPQSVPC